MLHVHLLGGFRLQSGNEIITTLTVPRLQSLLAYLLLHREAPQLRQHLAFLFWPDSTEAQARTNLRRALHDLRQALPHAAAYLEIQTQWIQWRSDTVFTLDVSEFEAACMQAEQWILPQQTEAAVTALAHAVELYRGYLLPGVYDDWLLAKRDELAQRLAQALDRLLHLLESRQDYAAAIGFAQRLLRHDPLAETTYQHLMRLHALQGDRTAALRVYHECAAMLARELGVEPSAETHAAYVQLLHPEATAPLPAEQLIRQGDMSWLIGREAEWQHLLLAWQRASQGHAQVVAITGEAGIGKTRLAESLVSWVSRQGLRAASTRAYEAEGSLAFAPLVDLLRTDTLVPSLSDLSDVWLAQVARLLPELHDLRPNLPQRDSVADPLHLQHFYEALVRVVLGDGRPLLLVLDDLQWCDHETLAWLRYLLHYAPQAKLLVVVTVRSGEATANHPLHTFLLSLRREHRLTELPLTRLTQAHTLVLAAQIAGRMLEADQAALLYRQTEGNPLFVVEMVRAEVARWTAGASRAASVDAAGVVLPKSVQAVIQARLAQLTPLAQEVTWLAAVIGRAFSIEVLAHAGGYGEDELVRSLDELWQRHIVREQGANQYDFSHPLMRAVAYSQISPMRRRLLHRHIAQALEIVYRAELDGVSGLVATHYELAGNARQAIVYYQRAARFAKQTYAHLKAASELYQALALLQTLPEDDARRRQEVDIQMELGFVLMMAKGWADPEAQQAYDRALALCHDADTGMYRFDASWGLHEIYLFQANRTKALEASQICWELAQQSDDPELLLQAHHAFWGVYLWFYADRQGLQTAVDHTQQGIALYRPEWHRAHVLRYGGHDPGVCAHFMQAKAQWLLGYPDQAVALVRKAVDLATYLGHPFTLCQALLQAAVVHAYRGEVHQVLASVEQARPIVVEQNMPLHNALEFVLRGWALGQREDSSEAAALVQQGVSIWQEAGVNLEQPYLLALLAETQVRAGQNEAARQTIEQALAIGRATGENYWQPETYRLYGQILLAAGDVDAALSSFQQGLAIAQIQRTKSLELRAATNLSQMLTQQGRPAQAYTLLSGIYSWFREGFDTADLRAGPDPAAIPSALLTSVYLGASLHLLLQLFHAQTFVRSFI